MKYLVSAFADEYSDVFDEQLSVLCELGIKYIEIRHANGRSIADFSESEVSEYSRKIRACGLGVSALGSPVGKIPIDGDMEAHLKTAEKIFAMAGGFSAKYVRVFSFYLPKNSDLDLYRAQVLRYMEKLVCLAEKYGVTLCHENEAYIYGESPERCFDLSEYFGGKLRCVFDMGNFVLDGYDPLAAFGRLRPYIAYFHIKDALREGAVVPAGKGQAKIKEILSAFETEGEERFITYEPHLQTFSGLNALAGKTFENPYQFENQKTAFTEGYKNLKEILTEIGE